MREMVFEHEGRTYIEAGGQLVERHVFHDGYVVERVVKDPPDSLCRAARIEWMRRVQEGHCGHR